MTHRAYRRGSVQAGEIELATLQRQPLSSSHNYGDDDDDFHQAFAAFKERERRRRSSAWRTENNMHVLPKLNKQKSQTTELKGTNLVVIVCGLVVAAVLVIALYVSWNT